MIYSSAAFTVPYTASDIAWHLKLPASSEAERAYLDELIGRAINEIEEATSSYIVRRAITLVAYDIDDIPVRLRGPVNSITSVRDADAEDIVHTVSYGGSAHYILPEEPQDKMIIVYNAGYPTIPASVKGAIYELVTCFHEHRGDEGGDFLPAAVQRVLRRLTPARFI
jgi:hypothetical protein